MKVLLYSGIGLLIGAFIHLVTWLVSKGIIWVAFELFNVNWYNKFWVVYVMVWILDAVFYSGKTNFRNKD